MRKLALALFLALGLGPVQAQPGVGPPQATVAVGVTSNFVGIVPVVSPSAENNRTFKASPGNLYSAYFSNQTATAGFLVILNLTAAPADGAITPLECIALPASGVASVTYNPGPPSTYSVGITAVATSGANCFTKTTGVITGFFKGSVQ